MPTIDITCDKCGLTVPAYLGQAIANGNLVWSIGYVCRHCQTTIEADDQGLPPEEYRQAIITSGGKWELRLVASDNSTALTAKALRDVFAMSLASAVNNSKDLASPIFIGTYVETQWFAQRLRESGLAYDIRSVT